MSELLHQLQQENQHLKQHLGSQQKLVNSLERRVGRSLSVMREQIGLLHQPLPDHQIWQRHLGLMQDELHRLRDLLEDALLLQKLEAGKVEIRREAIALQSLFHAVSHHLLDPRWGYASRLGCQVAAGLPAIWGDRELTEAVLTDLLIRGLKYSDADAIVTLGASVELGSVFLWVNAQRFAPAGHRDFATEIALCCKRIEVQGGEVTCQMAEDGLTKVAIHLPAITRLDDTLNQLHEQLRQPVTIADN